MKLLTAYLFFTLALCWCHQAQAASPQTRMKAYYTKAPVAADSTLPVWSKHKLFKPSPTFQSSILNTAALLTSNRSVKGVLGFTQNNRPVEIYYFPGTSTKKALVIGGVHGSELSAMEVVKQMVADLSNGKQIYYSVIVIPCLFPDNAAAAAHCSTEINSTKNIGRYTAVGMPDPNRQMPPLGKAFKSNEAFDYAARPIERENQMLLQVIQDFKPDRIINVHAIRNVVKAGIFADPRTDCEGIALGYETDSLLALKMATFIHKKGGNVSGNGLAQNKPTTLYSSDPPIAPKGHLQKRNLRGSVLPNNLGTGVSLGAWASTAVCNADGQMERQAMRVITVEFPGNKRPTDYTKAEKGEHEKQLRLYAAAISQVFLAQQLVETESDI